MNSKNKKDPVDLSSLYPRAKTYDELVADRKRIDEKKEARKPKHIAIQVALRLTFVFAYIVLFVALVPQLIYSGIPGVCACFLLLIVLSGVVWLTVKSVDRLIQFRNGNLFPVLAVYPACTSPLLAIAIGHQFEIEYLVGLVAASFLIGWLIMAISLAAKITDVTKMFLLAAIWLAVAAIAVFTV